MAETSSSRTHSIHSPSLDNVLQELQHWRDNKTQQKSRSIPDGLWRKFFILAETYTDKTIRSVFSLNSSQYKIKYEQLVGSNASAAVNGAANPLNIPSQQQGGNKQPAFCEATMLGANQHTQAPPLSSIDNDNHANKVSLAKLKSTKNEPEQFLDLTTIIVECIHTNGHRLKIHTTHKNITQIMQAFYQTADMPS